MSGFNWITIPIKNISESKVCPRCNSNHTESKGKRELTTEMVNKRVCRDCNLYYYVRLYPMQKFYSV